MSAYSKIVLGIALLAGSVLAGFEFLDRPAPPALQLADSPPKPPAKAEKPPGPVERALGASATKDVEAKVEKTYDGDTLLLDSGELVRLLGVDTPETHHPDKPAQAFGEEASTFTRERTEGKTVRLVRGPELRDAYGRILARVVLPDGTELEKALLSEGLALAMPRFAGEKKEEYLRIEAEARRAGKGLWKALLDSPEAGRLMMLYNTLDETSRRKAIGILEGLARDAGAKEKAKRR